MSTTCVTANGASGPESAAAWRREWAQIVGEETVKYSNQASEEFWSLKKSFVEDHAVKFRRRFEDRTNFFRFFLG